MSGIKEARFPVELDGEYGVLVKAEIVARYTYHPPAEGARGDYGVPIEPDEPAHVELQSVELVIGGRAIDAKIDRDEIAERCLELEEV